MFQIYTWFEPGKEDIYKINIISSPSQIISSLNLVIASIHSSSPLPEEHSELNFPVCWETVLDKTGFALHWKICKMLSVIMLPSELRFFYQLLSVAMSQG